MLKKGTFGFFDTGSPDISPVPIFSNLRKNESESKVEDNAEAGKRRHWIGQMTPV